MGPMLGSPLELAPPEAVVALAAALITAEATDPVVVEMELLTELLPPDGTGPELTTELKLELRPLQLLTQRSVRVDC